MAKHRHLRDIGACKAVLLALVLHCLAIEYLKDSNLCDS